jgi:hypothetical protein
MLFCYQKIDGGGHDKKDFDFLSSIEVSSFDPYDLFTTSLGCLQQCPLYTFSISVLYSFF